MEQIALPFVIIGIVEQFKSSFPQINGFYTMLLAIAIGAIAGYFHVEGVDIYHGIIYAISAVGIHTAASAVGKPKGGVPEVPSEPTLSVVNGRVNYTQS